MTTSLLTLKPVLALIAQLHALALKKRSATQRELYYRAPDVFDSQQQVNVLLQDLTCILEVPRASLSVFASERGSVAGLLEFKGRGSSLKCNSGVGVMISEALLEAETLTTSASYIIVVEKDAIFQALCQQEFWNVLPCILMTGRGFPDFATRKLLRHLGCQLGLEAGYLGDYDPHGLQIFLTYQYGSKTFEGKQLAWEPLRWLGMLAADTEALPAAALLQQGPRDRALLQSLLVHPGVTGNEKILTECQRMLLKGVKCEVEALESLGPDHLGRNYIATKILRRKWL